MDRNAKAAKGGDKDAARKKDLFERMRKHLDDGKPVRSMGLTKEEKADSQELHLLTAKPVMYVANVKEDGFTNNPHLDAVTARAKAEGAVVVAVCAAIEAEISQLEEADRADFLHDLGLDEPGLNRVIRAGYELLGLQTYFTAGVKEVRAWTVQRRFDRAAGRGRDPHRFRTRLHPRRSHRLRRLHQVPGRGRARRMPASCGSRARNTSSRKATSCTSASTSSSRGQRPVEEMSVLARVRKWLRRIGFAIAIVIATVLFVRVVRCLALAAAQALAHAGAARARCG